MFTSLRFEDKLEMVIVRAGEEFSWTLPLVINAFEDKYEIIIEPDL